MSTTDALSPTVLVVDHRQSTSMGWPGETALDCSRSAALEAVADRRRTSTPVGLVTVGDEGITGWEPLSATSSQYAVIDQRLRELQPTVPAEAPVAVDDSDRQSTPTIDARRASWTLRGDESPFAATVRAYLEPSVDYHRRIGENQLRGAIQFALRRVPDRVSIVLFADDSRPEELRTAVEAAREGGNRVVVYLTPRAFFERRDIGDAEATYRDYREFDRLERALENHRHVIVHEVTPI